MENLSAYPPWLVATCMLVVLTGVGAFCFKVFRFVIVSALVVAGLILTAFVTLQLTD
jgi:hypothetical protein